MILVRELKKEFDGFQALRGLNLQVRTGEIYGFIGRNGAGKSTALNILAGLSRPMSGECVVNGHSLEDISHPGDLNIGYLPEEPRFYPWMTAGETLGYLSGSKMNKRISEILQWTGLSHAADRRVRGFSRGMRQRLGIGAALIGDFNLLILDEPSSALDPEGRSEVLHLIEKLKNMGKTILFSTHILEDVERICDTVGMISEGKMVFEKSREQLQKENTNPIFDIASYGEIDEKKLQGLRQVEGVLSLNISERIIAVRVQEAGVSGNLMRFLAEHQITVYRFELRKTRLEDVFLQEVNRNEI